MNKKESINDIVKTNMYLPRRLYDSLKLMAVLTRSSMTRIVQEAVRDKLEELREQYTKNSEQRPL